MDILFDEKGFLKPYDILEMSLGDFQTAFVVNNHRAQIFENYLHFLDLLREAGLTNFYQWLDGSFVSKKVFPNDLDLVTFVDWQWYRTRESRLRVLELEFRERRLDAYTVPVYPETDFKKYITIYAANEKRELYGSDRIGNPKGFVQINY